LVGKSYNDDFSLHYSFLIKKSLKRSDFSRLQTLDDIAVCIPDRRPQQRQHDDNDKGDQGDDKRVLDQALSVFFLVRKHPQSSIVAEKKILSKN
jgi:hypothetical protein